MKTLLLFVLMLSSMTVFSQKNLYRGIKSGMTYSEFDKYCASDKNFYLNKWGNQYLVKIDNREYAVIPLRNEKNIYKGLELWGEKRYELNDYEINLKDNVLDLYNLLKTKYGDPAYFKFPQSNEFEILEVCAKWISGSLSIDIIIMKWDDGLGVIVRIIDFDFNNTGGF
jgi:hypothetical protein